MSHTQGLETQVTTLINKSHQRGTTKRGPVYKDEGAVGRWAPHVPMTSQSTVRTQEIPNSIPWQLNADTSTDIRRHVPKWLMIDDYGNSLDGSLVGLTRGVLRRHVNVTMAALEDAEYTDLGREKGVIHTAYQMPRATPNSLTPFATSRSHHNVLSCPNRIYAVKLTTTAPIAHGSSLASVDPAGLTEILDTMSTHNWYVRTESDNDDGFQLSAIANMSATVPKHRVSMVSVESQKLIFTPSFSATNHDGSVATGGSIPAGTTLIVFRRTSRIMSVRIEGNVLTTQSDDDDAWLKNNADRYSGSIMNLTNSSAGDKWQTGIWDHTSIATPYQPIKVTPTYYIALDLFRAHNVSPGIDDYEGNVEVFENAHGSLPDTDRVLHDIGRNSLRQFGVIVKYFTFKNEPLTLIRGEECGQWEWFWEGGSLTFFDPARIPGVRNGVEFQFTDPLTDRFPPAVSFYKYAGKFAVDTSGNGSFDADVQIGSSSFAGTISPALQFGGAIDGGWRIALERDDTGDTMLVIQKYEINQWINKSVLTG